MEPKRTFSPVNRPASAARKISRSESGFFINKINLLILLAIFTLTACENTGGKAKGTVSNGIDNRAETWSFSPSTDYTYNGSYVDLSSGRASLKTVNTTFNSASTLSSGTHVGTYWDSTNSKLTLATGSASNFDLRYVLPARASALAGYWKFDDNYTDSSGNSRTLTPQGNPTFASGRFGSAAALDGSGDYYEFTTPFVPSNNVTYSAWVWRSSSIVNFGVFFSGARNGCSPSAFDIRVRTSNQRPEIGVGCAGAQRLGVSAGTTAGAGQWHHIAVTRDAAGSAKIYLDGELRAGPADIRNTQTEDTLQALVIGGLFSGGSLALSSNGYIDEAAVWNAELSATEIAAIYAAQATPAANDTSLSSNWTPKWSNLVGYWPLDGSGNDATGTGNNGTVAGNPTYVTGKVGAKAFVPDGTGDYVDIPNHATLDISGSITLSVWFKVSAWTKAWEPLITKGDTAYRLQRCSSSDAIQFGTSGLTNGAYCGTTPVADDRWHHVMAVYDSVNGQKTLYLDGVQEANTAATGTLSTNNYSVRLAGNSEASRDGATTIDDAAIWNTALTADEAKIIYNRQKQKYAGTYTSPVIDMGATGAEWTNIRAVTALPFMKELPSSTANGESANYSAMGSASFDADLVGLWHMNQSSWTAAAGQVIDSSGKNKHGTAYGGLTTASGVLGRGAGKFDGVDDYILVPSYTEVTSYPFTIAAWVNIPTLTNAAETTIWSLNLSATEYYSLRLNNATLTYTVRSPVSGVDTARGAGYAINRAGWHHIVMRFISDSAIDLSINGVYQASTYANGLPFVAADKFYLGKLRSAVSPPPGLLDGMDEVAIWKRALSSTEIQQLYRRGANRVKIQARSCADINCACKSITTGGSAADCSNDGTANDLAGTDANRANWIGPDGTASTYFSELQNNTSVDASGNPTGAVNAGTLNLDFSSTFFTSAARPATNQYFQYRTYLESDDTGTTCSGSPCLPDLTSMEVGPTGRYYAGKPTVQNNIGLSYSSLLSFLKSDTNACTKFQLSSDGVNWRYWNGSAWAAATTDAQTNFSSDFTGGNLGAFGSGSFYFKAFLNTNANFSQSCDLSSVGVTYK